MGAATDLLDTYQEWRQWTQAEGEAIRIGNWNRVQECQGSKVRLQPRIIRLAGPAQKEWGQLGLDVAEKEQEVRAAVDECIRLETLNGDLLAKQREAAVAKQTELDQTSRNLKLIHRSYVPAQSAAWTSFS